ncbi:hypothetical protein CYR55_01220 [Chimaeribacter californicus]|uniref:Uncharacterized protein YobH n=1 Tax=Chimaeribacter californicus TaxID=2060067 RepID=A0A2N5EG39_9GAMM|nr:YobH family protein [Chimaeribacter californicus]PLR41485.1 hypothetical protein CYR55_01220 [Chimaeribacter californicus]
MRFKGLACIALLYGVFLFSGYGVLAGSEKNGAGLGLHCRYLTARGMVSAQFLHSDSGIIGVSQCPLLKKAVDVVE